ncbi:MAG TPA: SGNH/GDSL hydrolase family protein [Jatrophihabitans sp.]|nr:SGNH/GDSL hydrolase family protein [Jatrophihabitans sp.]
MQGYQAKFTDAGEVRWLPYLMYFHPAGHRSEVVNTDGSGFRYSVAHGRRYSAADRAGIESVRVLAGSSTVFGIGASTDAWTLPSRLTEHDPRGEPWLNFGGRSFNSTQEMLLLTMYRHLLPKVEEIVLFSGFNNLGLARLPESVRGEHGAFFNCNAFFDAFGPDGDPGRRRRSVRQRLGRAAASGAEPVPSLDAQLGYASELTLRHLAIWQALAVDLGARLTFVLQPLAGWVRPVGSPEEEELFAELDELGRFSEVYGDILTTAVNTDYAAAIEAGAKQLGVDFVNLSPVLADRLAPDQWLFVDRIHFTDAGHDFVARLLLDLLDR